MESGVEFIAKVRDAVLAEMAKVIVGQEETLEGMLVGLLVKGHVLLEGVPGTAKTLMVRTLSKAMAADFKRVQFTPDLMPSDMVGTNVFNFQKGEFRLNRGPIFTDLLLTDEINRAPAKTQSALLEAMEERRVSIDGVTHELSRIFMVFATQNPVEYEGTYPLPEAQLDRFLLKLRVDYPSQEEEDRILLKFHQGFDSNDLDAVGVKAVISAEDVERARTAVVAVRVEGDILRYIRSIARATRTSPSLLLGGGPRASIYLLLASKVLAAMRGRDFVTPDDVRQMAYPVLRHRLVLEPELEMDGVGVEEVLDKVFDGIEVPR